MAAEVNFDLSGRRVIVTGAASGIGRAIATFLTAAGAEVGLIDINDAAVRSVAAELDGSMPLAADVSSSAAVGEAVARFVAEGGSIDGLVNCAGIVRYGRVWELTDEDWNRVLGVHLNGTFHLIRAVAPVMRAAGYGRIVNITSFSGLHGAVGTANYSSAKGALISLTRTCAKELAASGITVNAISPVAETPILNDIPNRGADLIPPIPMGRLADPSEIAPPVAFLLSETAGYITGVTLPIDGGLSL